MSSLRARLIEKALLSPDIADFRFQILDGHLTCLEPGAHVDVGLAPDLVRQYSLWNWDAEGRWLNIAVKHEADGRFDIAAVMQSMPMGGDVYACGPERLLDDILQAGSGLRGGAIRFERFAAAATFADAPNDTFEIELQSSGEVLTVGPEETILDVLRGHGVQVDFGCYEGLCGSCMVDVVEGEVDHRDGVLSPEEQEANAFMCACVSRARSGRLVLRL